MPERRMIRDMFEGKPLRSRYTSESFRPSETMSDPIAFLQRVPECPAVPSHAIPEVHPKTNIDPTIDLWLDAQRPYGLIRPHHVFSEPSRLRRLVGVRHVPIPALWSPELSGAPGVTSGLENILLLNDGIPRP
jgi:hypothetical protein